MDIRILDGRLGSCLFCNETKFAFGPVFPKPEEAKAFMDWFCSVDKRDMRTMGTSLGVYYEKWQKTGRPKPEKPKPEKKKPEIDMSKQKEIKKDK